MTIWPRSAIAIGASLLSVSALVALPASTSPVQTSDVSTSFLADGGVVRLHLGKSDYFRFDAADGRSEPRTSAHSAATEGTYPARPRRGTASWATWQGYRWAVAS